MVRLVSGRLAAGYVSQAAYWLSPATWWWSIITNHFLSWPETARQRHTLRVFAFSEWCIELLCPSLLYAVPTYSNWFPLITTFATAVPTAPVTTVVTVALTTVTTVV